MKTALVQDMPVGWQRFREFVETDDGLAFTFELNAYMDDKIVDQTEGKPIYKVIMNNLGLINAQQFPISDVKEIPIPIPIQNPAVIVI